MLEGKYLLCYECEELTTCLWDGLQSRDFGSRGNFQDKSSLLWKAVVCITPWQPLWLEWFKEFLSPNPCHCPSTGNCSLLRINCDFESAVSLQNEANELGLRSHQEWARLCFCSGCSVLLQLFGVALLTVLGRPVIRART